MLTEAKQPQPDPQQPAMFDADRMLDLLEAKTDSYLSMVNEAKNNGIKDQTAETGFDRMSGYQDIIQRHPADGKTPRQYLEFLKEVAKRKTDELQEHPNDRRAAELEMITGAIGFVESDLMRPGVNNDVVRSHRERQRRSEEQRVEGLKLADETASAQQINEVRAEAGLDKEQEKKELIDEVVKICGANFFTAWPKSVAPEGTSGGFFEKQDNRFLKPQKYNGVTPRMKFLTGADNFRSKYPEHGHKSIDQSMGDLGITEVLYLEPAEEAVTESRITYEEQKQGGILGFGAKTVQVPKTERVVTGTRNVAMSEQVKGGNNEACYRLSYTTSSRDQNRRYDYQATDGRNGQTFNAEILLPEDLAIKVVAMIRDDPNFLHSLIDELAIRDMHIPEEVWREGAADANGHPLRPPYEKWRETDGGKSKLYLVEKAQIQEQIEQSTVDFDPRFVVEY